MLDLWAQGKSKIHTEIYADAQRKIEPFTAAGFFEDGHREDVGTYVLAGYDVSYRLEPGFELMISADCPNAESRIALVRNAFDNPHYSEARYQSTRNSPNYRPELDLVVVSPAGECVAFCMGWIEENDPTTGFIEPMGTHSEFRRLGFGKALAKACFKRLGAMGVDRVWIVSHADSVAANRLYESLNPDSVRCSFTYSLVLESDT